MNEFERFLKVYFRGSGRSLNYTMSDEDVSGSLTTQIAERDLSYTHLLDNYKALTKWRGILKEIHKWLFFWLVITACVFGMICIYRILKKVVSVDDIHFIIDSIPIVVTAMVSLISTIIVVPVTISKFLFNTKEDDSITAIIKHTQEHDAASLIFFKERFIPKPKEQQKFQSIDSDDF